MYFLLSVYMLLASHIKKLIETKSKWKILLKPQKSDEWH